MRITEMPAGRAYTVPDVQLTEQIRKVVSAATRAPSVHNTQPWRFSAGPDSLDLYADQARRLAVVDPSGRQVDLSCGAALFHARAAARGLGLDVQVAVLPDPAVPDLLARLRLAPGTSASAAELELAAAIDQRHTFRDAFEDRVVPDRLIERLRLVAEAEGAVLRPVTEPDDLVELEVLLSSADAAEEGNEGYRQELASWVGKDAGSADGVPTSALASEEGDRGSSLRLRDFALTRPDLGTRSAAGPPVAEHPAVVVLATDRDDRRAWLQAGQALGAVLLVATSSGLLAQPLGQVTDLPGHRARLRSALGMVGVPQLVLRMGFARGAQADETPRRPLGDVLPDA